MNRASGPKHTAASSRPPSWVSITPESNCCIFKILPSPKKVIWCVHWFQLARGCQSKISCWHRSQKNDRIILPFSHFSVPPPKGWCCITVDFSPREMSERFSNKSSNLQIVFQSYCSSLQLSSVWPPLPICLLRGLQGGISPNYLYWSGETGEYQTGRSSPSSSCFFHPSILPSLLPRGEKTHRSVYVSGIALTATTFTASAVAVIYCSHSGCCD